MYICICFLFSFISRKNHIFPYLLYFSRPKFIVGTPVATYIESQWPYSILHFFLWRRLIFFNFYFFFSSSSFFLPTKLYSWSFCVELKRQCISHCRFLALTFVRTHFMGCPFIESVWKQFRIDAQTSVEWQTSTTATITVSILVKTYHKINKSLFFISFVISYIYIFIYFCNWKCNYLFIYLGKLNALKCAWHFPFYIFAFKISFYKFNYENS